MGRGKKASESILPVAQPLQGLVLPPKLPEFTFSQAINRHPPFLLAEHPASSIYSFISVSSRGLGWASHDISVLPGV